MSTEYHRVAASTTQPQGFRADLWARLNEWVTANWLNTLGDIRTINDRGISGHSRRYSWDELGLDTTADEADRQTLIARWTVYQELKPLYDLVDGGEGEVAMPADVEVAWYSASVNERRRAIGGWILARDVSGLLIKNNRNTVNWCKDEPNLGAPLRNFAAVLDAVAERRVAERMRGQTQATTVTSAQPEPRRFADVRPDRHGWRWWRIVGGPDAGIIDARFEVMNARLWRWLPPLIGDRSWARIDSIWSPRTVIPTDEQGNSVSWEAVGFAAESTRSAQQAATGQPVTRDMAVEPATGVVRSRHVAGNTGGFSIESPTPPRPGQFSNNPAAPPLTPEGLLAVTQNYAVPGIHVTVGTGAKQAQTEAITTWPPPLPRFTADELDDVDHSKTTKLDEATLRRGKLPTVEQIAKYREVRAKRTGGTVADALKESRIDCEVAQYVLERWAGGLGDEESRILIETASRFGAEHKVGTHLPAFAVDSRIQWYTQNNQTLDTSEKPSPAVQRERQEAEERRQQLAKLRQRLAAERAVQPQEMARKSEVSRFDLIEPDPQADPAASICAWEARQAAAKVRHTAAPSRIAKPAAALRRPAIEVVDAEVDGLSRSEAFAALFGRALNGGC